MNDKKIIIGSRGSDLALWQANHVQAQLKAIGADAEIKIIKTQGDKIQHLSFDKMEGKGFFTKEIEEALLSGDIDLAIHSHKDLPTTAPNGLIIAAVSEREDPSELILIRKESVDLHQQFSFKKCAVVGTSSARRKSQLLSFRGDIEIKDLRGNVPTRINKLREKQYDAILLAAAGVQRLKIDLSEFHVEKLNPEEFVPAPAQGVLALQIRETDKELFNTLQELHCKEVDETIAIERKVLNLFDGGCQLPLGVYCRKEDGQFKVWTAKTEQWDGLPKRLYTESESSEGLSAAIVEKLNNVKGKNIFITRDLGLDSIFRKSLEGNGYKVSGISLIHTERVPFDKTPSADWVFFSSKKAVRHFFEQNPQLGENVKYATIGQSTARVLKEKGMTPAFVGASNDTQLVGRHFAKIAKGETILFPQAKHSIRSVQQELAHEHNAIDLVVYETKHKQEIVIPAADVLVFTSPSNVEAFFAGNEITGSQQVIAIGKNTGKKLEEHNITDYTLPRTFDELGLVEAVFGL